MAIYDYDFHFTDKDKWFKVEKQIQSFLGPEGNAIDFQKPQSVVSWNRTWADFIIKRSRSGPTSNRWVAWFKVAQRMTEQHKSIKYMSHGKNGGVKIRVSKFPPMDTPPNIMDWGFCNYGEWLTDAHRDLVKEIATQRLIHIQWRQEIPNKSDKDSKYRHQNSKIITWREVLKHIESEFDSLFSQKPGTKAFENIKKILEENKIWSNYCYAHQTLMSDFYNSNLTKLCENQIKLDYSVPLPDIDYITARLTLGDSWDTAKSKHKKLTNEILSNEKYLSEWENEEWVAQYVQNKRDYYRSILNDDKKREEELSDTIKASQKIISDFEEVIN